jgi:hypothetical protein
MQSPFWSIILHPPVALQRLLPEGRRWPLRLTDCKTMPNSGIVMLKYAAGPG